MLKPSRTRARASGVKATLVTAAALSFALLASAVDWGGATEQDSIVVTAVEATAQGAPTQGVSHSWRVEEWVRAPACAFSRYRLDLMPGCVSPLDVITVLCPDGTNAVDPWWMRYRTSSGAWSKWLSVSWYQCPADQFRASVENAWDRMYIAPNTISIQPATGWVLTTVPTVVYVDLSPRTMRTTLLGTPVTIRATASAYTWTWGDGSSPTVTTKPGAPYPNSTVDHTYLHYEGDVTISLMTSWTGSYSTDGGASWRTAPGTAYTTSTPVTITVYDPHGHRVDCDLEGTCVSGADGPSDET